MTPNQFGLTIVVTYLIGIPITAVLLGRWLYDDTDGDPFAYVFGVIGALFWPFVALAWAAYVIGEGTRKDH
ncbi:MAG TPA: hypothetical protein VJ742_12910 [Nitrososphaera sp.]|nr:hypothetical protein [Nitrososphaera sp.]